MAGSPSSETFRSGAFAGLVARGRAGVSLLDPHLPAEDPLDPASWTAHVPLPGAGFLSELVLPETWRRLPPAPGSAHAAAGSVVFGDDRTLSPALETTIAVSTTPLPAGTDLAGWQAQDLDALVQRLPHVQVIEDGPVDPGTDGPAGGTAAAAGSPGPEARATWHRAALVIDPSGIPSLVRQRSRIIGGTGVRLTLTTSPEVDALHGEDLDRIVSTWRTPPHSGDPSAVLSLEGDQRELELMLEDLAAFPAPASAAPHDPELTDLIHRILTSATGNAAVFLARPDEVLSHELTISRWWTLRRSTRDDGRMELAVFPTAGLAGAILHLAGIGPLPGLPARPRMTLRHEGLEQIWSWDAQERRTGWELLRRSADARPELRPGAAAAAPSSDGDCAIRVIRHGATGVASALVVRLRDRYLVAAADDLCDALFGRTRPSDRLTGTDPMGATRHLIGPLVP